MESPRLTRIAADERGSALILVVLLTLILSATAIVALRDVARTTRASAVYRTHAQSRTTSDSADRLFLALAGDRAPALVHAMQQGGYGDVDDDASTTDDSGIYGGGADDGFDFDGADGVTLDEKRRALVIRGVDLEFTPEDLAQSCGTDCEPLLPNWADGEETGLFRTGTTADDATFETRRPTTWRVRIRDLSDGPPAPGYSEDCRFKRALLVAESRVGEPDPEWTRANNVATSRHGIDAMIGPICKH